MDVKLLPPDITPEAFAEFQLATRHDLWRLGALDFKRHRIQKLSAITLAICPPGGTVYENWSRRIGKSHGKLLDALELCLKKPNARVLYLLPYAKDAAEIAFDLSANVLADCPPDVRPDYSAQLKEFTFKNGSVIRLKGVNGEHAQFLRGGAYDLIILDECGLMDDLKHVVNDVCAPMTMTTGGKIVLASTPPMSPDHEAAEFFERCAGAGLASTFTLRDAHDLPHLSDSARRAALIAAGEDRDRVDGILFGELQPETTTAQREYFCLFVTDASKAVVPEYGKVRTEVLIPWARPPYYDAYVAMDPGFNDRTGLLFAYWDFIRGKLVIEDERLLVRANTEHIAMAVKDVEKVLWPDQRPFLRISDIDLRLIADLYQMHGLHFSPAEKQDSLGAVNLMRNWIQQKKVIIHPRCTNLDRQLTNATWNSKATDFERGKEGHYDLVAALKYLVRHVLETKNPYPDNWFAIGGPGGLPAGTYVSPKLARLAAARRKALTLDTPLNRRLARRRR